MSLNGSTPNWQRVTTASTVLRSTARFSFYHDLIGKYWAGGPDEVTAGAMHRICTLARKMGVKTVEVECALNRADVMAEVETLEAATTTSGAVSAVQMTFLRRRVGQTAIVPRDVIGQCVVITFPKQDGEPKSYVFEGIMVEPSRDASVPLLNNYISLKADFEISVGGSPVTIRGSYFTQQNGITSVCAHAAVRTVLRHRGVGAPTIAELNALWSFDSPQSRVTTQDVKRALEGHGGSVAMYDLTDPRQAKDAPANDGIPWSLLCALIESGTAAMLTFGVGYGVDHVVPLIGFTLNTDEWHPGAAEMYSGSLAGLMSSSLWIDHIVIHDDLRGPYYCLSKSCFGERPSRSQGMSLVPKTALVVLPEKVTVSAPVAEAIASANLNALLGLTHQTGIAAGRWWATMASATRRVMRTTLVDRETYLEHIARKPGSRTDWVTPDNLAEFRDALPSRFWLCEISLPQLFVGNRTKLGEILVDAGELHTGNLLGSVIGFRFPSVLSYAKDQLDVLMRTGCMGHVPILRGSAHANQW